jgi:hypothetical protein
MKSPETADRAPEIAVVWIEEVARAALQVQVAE